MSGSFGITYKQLLPKLFLPVGSSAMKHGPNSSLIRELIELYIHKIATKIQKNEHKDWNRRLEHNMYNIILSSYIIHSPSY
jgi:hypothetical protein